MSFSVPSVLVPGEYLALPISRRDGRGSDGGGGGGGIITLLQLLWCLLRSV